MVCVSTYAGNFQCPFREGTQSVSPEISLYIPRSKKINLRYTSQVELCIDPATSINLHMSEVKSRPPFLDRLLAE